MDRSRLVWLDPDKPDPQPEKAEPPLWEYREAEAIVGQPHLMKGILLVADQAGRFVALDPATGKMRKHYTLHGNMSATVSPVPFGPAKAFAPMTDGTVLLLSGE